MNTDDFERGKEAAMDADMYEFDARVVSGILDAETKEFKAGWYSYYTDSSGPTHKEE